MEEEEYLSHKELRDFMAALTAFIMLVSTPEQRKEYFRVGYDIP